MGGRLEAGRGEIGIEGVRVLMFGEDRANLSAFRTFVRLLLVCTCRFPLPLSVWEGLRFVIVALPGRFSYLFFYNKSKCVLMKFMAHLRTKIKKKKKQAPEE